eukprot:GHVO01066165.1.p1 GENE.GHVO01066165.1~~GHVO01066165.1.p1  ORF type:complete len:380 (+),score=48.67 GHVO01066165.1:24-1163(+)
MGGIISSTGEPISPLLPRWADAPPRCRVFHDRMLADHYNCSSEIIGKGLSGSVRIAECKYSHRKHSLKSFDRSNKKNDDEAWTLFRREMAIHLYCDHPNIARLIAVYEEPRMTYAVMEFCAGSDLQQTLESTGPLPESLVVILATEILWALNYLHRHGVVHRDLKLENLIADIHKDKLAASRIKLIDFGLATAWDESMAPMTDQCGSLSYISPELLGGSYGSKTDIWSLGVVLYRMFLCVPPFYGTENQIIERITTGQYALTGHRWSQASPEFKDLVSKCLTLDPDLRPSASELLEHEIFDNLSTGEIPTCFARWKRQSNREKRETGGVQGPSKARSRSTPRPSVVDPPPGVDFDWVDRGGSAKALTSIFRHRSYLSYI